jgi:dTMP kinase
VVTEASQPAIESQEKTAAAPAEPGKLITLEGGEGGGKTTQILRLAERLGKFGIRVTTTREPGGTPKAESIRRFLLSGAAKALGPEAEAVLFAAARADHVEALIRPALAKGSWVLCDRYIDSTRAYQGGAGVSLDLIVALEQATVGATRPDLTIVLDIPAELGLLRSAERHKAKHQPPDRFERDTLAEHGRRRQIFLEIAADEPERCVVVDASRPEAEVAEAIWLAVTERLGPAEKVRGGRP